MNVQWANGLSHILDWIHACGWLGCVAFALVFVVATLACVPASPLTAVAGFLYGPLWGTLLVSPIGVHRRRWLFS